jgi:hypothetical protein
MTHERLRFTRSAARASAGLAPVVARKAHRYRRRLRAMNAIGRTSPMPDRRWTTNGRPATAPSPAAATKAAKPRVRASLNHHRPPMRWSYRWPSDKPEPGSSSARQ